MRCFTLNESLIPGFKLQCAADSRVGVVLGDDDHTELLPASQSLSERFHHTYSAVQGFAEAGDPQARAILRTGVLVLPKAEVQVLGDSLLLAPQVVPSSCILLLVETAPGSGGHLQYTSRRFLRDKRSRLEREYKDFSDEGIEILAEVGNTRLLRIRPHSGFRLLRTGDLEGSPNSLSVDWTGESLKLRPAVIQEKERGPTWVALQPQRLV